MSEPEYEWYIKLDNVVRGPITSEGVHRLVASSRITSKTPIKLGLDGKWYPAGQIRGLDFKVRQDEGDAIWKVLIVLVVSVILFAAIILLAWRLQIAGIGYAFLFSSLVTWGFLMLGLSITGIKCDPNKSKWHFIAFGFGVVTYKLVHHPQTTHSQWGDDIDDWDTDD